MFARPPKTDQAPRVLWNLC